MQELIPKFLSVDNTDGAEPVPDGNIPSFKSNLSGIDLGHAEWNNKCGAGQHSQVPYRQYWCIWSIPPLDRGT